MISSSSSASPHLRQLKPILRSGKLCLLLGYIRLKLTCSVSVMSMTPANTMSSSTTNDTGAPPTKKVRTQEPQPEAEFKLGDVVVTIVYGDSLFKITGVEYDQGAWAWKFKGSLWDSDIEVSAPEKLLLKPEYRPDQRVSFKYKARISMARLCLSTLMKMRTSTTGSRGLKCSASSRIPSLRLMAEGQSMTCTA